MPLSSSPTHKAQEIAAIDLGSNSFHLIIARIVNNSLQILGRLKQSVRLAEGLDTNNQLSEEAITRGLNCLSLFAKRLSGFEQQNVRIVATHTLRQAINAKEFLRRAAHIFPYPIEIISGYEEARLIFMGVAHTQPEVGKKLVIDIGGGSTEIVIGEAFSPLLIASRHMGCVSFAQQFFPQGEISHTYFQQAYQAANQKLEHIAWQYRTHGWQSALGASGSIKMIHEVLQALGEKDGLITPERLTLLCHEILKFNHFSELKLPGLSEDRQNLFIPALAILCALFDSLAIKQLRFSDGALREGVLYEMEEQFLHQDIRRRTANSLAEHYNIDREQAQRVLNTVQQLYAQWQLQNNKLVHPQLESLLNWAALLYEVGLSINHNSLHRHSAYILQYSNLPGFNQEQQLLLATLVRLHRKSIRLNNLPSLTLFRKKQYIPLIQILRLGILLNNQRQATVPLEGLWLTTEHCHWFLRFPEGYLQHNDLLQLDLAKEQYYWQEVLGWQLIIR